MCGFENSFKVIAAVVWALTFYSCSVFAQGQTGAATVEFTQARYTIPPRTQAARISLRRTGATNSAVSVDFATSDDTAIAGIHYAGKNGTVNFQAGQTLETVTVPILAGAREEEKLVKLTLSNPAGGAVLGRSTAELVLPRVHNLAWVNFGLDRIEVLRKPLFEIPLWQYLASLIYVFLAFYFSKLLDFVIRGQLRRWALKSATPLDDLLLDLLRGPLKVITFVILLHIGLRVFAWPDWLADFISKALRIVVAVSVTYMALRFVDLATGYWKRRMTAHEDRPFSDQLLPIIRNTLKLFTVIVATLLTLQNLGLNVTSLIASLSIGGLALSLAAQDTLANLFGAIAILADKPFLIGDRIKLDQVEGVVESVGLRSTRVRTVAGDVVSIPNKTMGNAIVTKLASPQNSPAS